MKSALLIAGKVLLWLFLFLGIYLGLSFLLSYLPVNQEQKKNTARLNHLYAYSNGVHLDLVFPLDLVPASLLEQLPHDKRSQLLAFGWGDKGFYLDTPTWAELRPSVAIRAMLLPSPTAMHVTEHTTVGKGWSQLPLTDQQLSELWAYVQASFRTNDAGKVMELVGKGYTSHDRFYEAHGNYSLFKTCNTWVNIILRRIGVKTAVWTPMDKGVLRYLEPVQ
jgi:uncharacterized protein (TIGR02117 family)